MFKYLNAILVVILVLVWGSVFKMTMVKPFVKSVDPELQMYVSEYYDMVKTRCPEKSLDRSYKIEFAPDTDEWIGLCTFKLNGYHIQINERWWNKTALMRQKRLLMYHELSHCILEKEHIEDPLHYMYPFITFMYYEQYVDQVRSDIDEFCAQ